ncbi:MAG: polyphosphate polymerase domain-containing protein [Clostridia bacterium]|nr:polyphosphate polymerase domain-containing protein [Clostridia bacterium]
MPIEVFNRYEHKYILDHSTYVAVCSALSEHMELDKHNRNGSLYEISNIYYDTEDSFLIRNSISKPVHKQKLRLRSYGVPGIDDKVFLELKKKHDGLVNKRRTVLRLNEAYEFIKTGQVCEYKEYMNEQVIREISYFLSVYDVKPMLFLAYDRIAFFDINDHDLRISFDMNIRSRRDELFLEAGHHGTPVVDDEIYVMEIKTSRAKPLWLCDILSEHEIRRRSFSKYGTEYINYISGRHAPFIAGV